MDGLKTAPTVRVSASSGFSDGLGLNTTVVCSVTPVHGLRIVVMLDVVANSSLALGARMSRDRVARRRRSLIGS
ncbi:hypothetical protein D3C80_1725420 [compost metagenome]